MDPLKPTTFHHYNYRISSPPPPILHFSAFPIPPLSLLLEQVTPPPPTPEQTPTPYNNHHSPPLPRAPGVQKDWPRNVWKVFAFVRVSHVATVPVDSLQVKKLFNGCCMHKLVEEADYMPPSRYNQALSIPPLPIRPTGVAGRIRDRIEQDMASLRSRVDGSERDKAIRKFESDLARDIATSMDTVDDAHKADKPEATTPPSAAPPKLQRKRLRTSTSVRSPVPANKMPQTPEDDGPLTLTPSHGMEVSIKLQTKRPLPTPPALTRSSFAASSRQACEQPKDYLPRNYRPSHQYSGTENQSEWSSTYWYQVFDDIDPTIEDIDCSGAEDSDNKIESERIDDPLEVDKLVWKNRKAIVWKEAYRRRREDQKTD
ncbi:hypothetical protein MMC13_003697 [Lambiella insularis]|nr:hypothetical protein [Lambiella insularis]